MNTAPHESSTELAQRLDVSAVVGVIVSTEALSPTLYEVVIGRAASVAGQPGNDVMVRVADANGKYVRRRYSVRDVDSGLDQITLWVTTAHDGPGARWAQTARPGDPVDLVGPRGKITLDPLADWHLFIGDTSGLGAFYRMAQNIEAPGRAVFVVEINSPQDALTAPFDEGLGVTGIFIDRQGRAMNDATGVLSGLAAFDLPAGEGHAFLFGEFTVMKAANVALLDRGFDETQVSRKAFWRVGRNNADHGEPDKSET